MGMGELGEWGDVALEEAAGAGIGVAKAGIEPLLASG